MKDVKCIFFDIGSTLVDESAAYKDRIENTIAGSSVSYNVFTEKLIQTYRESAQRAVSFRGVCSFFGLEPSPWRSEYEFLYPETEGCLRTLSGNYKIGIIANQDPGSEERLNKLGLLKYLDLVIASAEEGVAKPDLRIFQIALDRANCKPEEAVMVGDRIDNDVFPANRIGMTTVWIRQGYGGCAEPKAKEELPDYTVHNLTEVAELFTRC